MKEGALSLLTAGCLLGMISWPAEAEDSAEPVPAQPRQEGRKVPAEAAEVEAETTKLSTVQVQGQLPSALTTPSIDEARDSLRRVPGGATVNDAEEYRRGGMSSLEDVLKFSPGVLAKSRYGGSESKVSIRGSGITQSYGVRGIEFMRDGMPLNFADGFYNTSLAASLNDRYTEVYRGANALQYGSSTLGGAINAVSRTGYTAAPLRLRLEGGSHGYVRPQVSGGKVLDDHWDVYGSASGSRRDGFRVHNKEANWQGYANIGYRHNDHDESRLHINIQDSDQDLPGSLTKAKLHDDPTQANDDYRYYNAGRHIRMQRVAFQHNHQFNDEDELQVGVYYQHLDMHHPLPYRVIDNERNDTGLNLRHTLHGELGGDQHKLTWGGRVSFGDNDMEEYDPVRGGHRGEQLEDGRQKALTGELFAQDEWQIAEDVALVPGIQFAYAQRDTKHYHSSDDDPDIATDYTGFSPKLGMLWDATDELQVFGNVSRSFEPPTFLELRNPVTGTLDAQKATTFEVGTRGEQGPVNWELTAYHSRVRDEIMLSEIAPGYDEADNADSTRHTGVEFGMGARLPLDDLALPGDVNLRANYTYNHFNFSHDEDYGNNRLPGIPEHAGRLEALYEHPSGGYIGPTMDVASAHYVDFANTQRANAYAIFGLRAGYDNDNGVSLFVEARNLGNKHHAADTGVVANARDPETDMNIYNPGVERSVIAGVDIHW